MHRMCAGSQSPKGMQCVWIVLCVPVCRRHISYCAVFRIQYLVIPPARPSPNNNGFPLYDIQFSFMISTWQTSVHRLPYPNVRVACLTQTNCVLCAVCLVCVCWAVNFANNVGTRAPFHFLSHWLTLESLFFVCLVHVCMVLGMVLHSIPISRFVLGNVKPCQQEQEHQQKKKKKKETQTVFPICFWFACSVSGSISLSVCLCVCHSSGSCAFSSIRNTDPLRLLPFIVLSELIVAFGRATARAFHRHSYIYAVNVAGAHNVDQTHSRATW